MKKYWLRFGLSLSFLVIVTTVLVVTGAVKDFLFIQHVVEFVTVGLLIPMKVIPHDLLLNKYQNENVVLVFFSVLIIWFVIGALLGYFYGKIKNLKTNV